MNQEQSKFTVASFCTGMATEALAFEGFGWEHTWFSEIDPVASALLRQRHPGIENIGDMTKATTNEHYQKHKSAVNLIFAGTPCQSFSVGGLRKGLADPRGNLTLHFIKLLDDARPAWFVWENVSSVLSSWTDAEAGPEGSVWQTNDFETFASGLQEIGYSIAWRVFDAQWFGVPQRRKRLFVVGYLGDDWRPPAAVLFEPQAMQTASEPSNPTRIVPACSARSHPGEPGNHYVIKSEAIGRSPTAGPQWGDYRQGASFTFTTENNHAVAYDLGQITSRENRSNPKPGDPLPTITTDGKMAVTVPRAWNISLCDSNGYRSDRPEGGFYINQTETAKTMTRRVEENSLIDHGWAVRRMTPLEYERGMGLPDHYTAITYKGKKLSDSRRYRLIGNGVAVPNLRWIGQRIKFVNHIIDNNHEKSEH